MNRSQLPTRSVATKHVLTHPCGTTVHLVDGEWTTPAGHLLTHCWGCGEWLGSAFLRVEELPRRPSTTVRT
jgi:hypothetical protein